MTKETSQLQRQKERQEQKHQEQMRKYLNSPATRADIFKVMEAFEKLRDRILHLDLFTAALEKVLLDRNILTRDEIEEAFKYEGMRTAKFKEINEMQGDYEKRLDLCNEWNIDPNITTIVDQIFADQALTEDQKKDLADKYNIERLKDLLNPKKEESKNE